MYRVSAVPLMSLIIQAQSVDTSPMDVSAERHSKHSRDLQSFPNHRRETPADVLLGSSSSRNNHDDGEEILINFATSDDLVVPVTSLQSRHSPVGAMSSEETEILLVDPPLYCTPTAPVLDDFSASFDILGMSSLRLPTNPFLDDILGELDAVSSSASTRPLSTFGFRAVGCDATAAAVQSGTAEHSPTSLHVDVKTPSAAGGDSSQRDAAPLKPNSLPLLDHNGVYAGPQKSPVSSSRYRGPIYVDTDTPSSDCGSQHPLLSVSGSPAPSSDSRSPRSVHSGAPRTPLSGNASDDMLHLCLDDVLAGFSMSSPVSRTAANTSLEAMLESSGPRSISPSVVVSPKILIAA